jgi:AcrR family transcriptional regulator/DNA-binding MarR family transcriptional regulator
MGVIYRQRRPGAPSRPARERLDRAEVAEIQRSRLIAAVIAAVEAQGYAGLTVGDVIACARISRKTFYDIFDGLEECFLEAVTDTHARAGEVAQTAYAGEPDWRSGMRAALAEVLALMERERGLARLCVVETLVAGPRVQARRAEALQQLATAIDAGRAVAGSHPVPSALTAQATAGGIASVLHTRLLREDPAPLTDLVAPFMSMVVMPYLGRAVAHEEAIAPGPQARRDEPARPQPGLDPLAELDMRVTYRTVRVLTAIAQTPDASNSQIARDAGIIDQGQVSKLLARLAGLGLIENTRTTRSGRGANAWRLTSFGERVQRATRGHRPIVS